MHARRVGRAHNRLQAGGLVETVDPGVDRHDRPVPIDPAPGARKNLSAETARLYAGDWAIFVTWCRGTSMPSLPATAAAVAAHLSAAAAGKLGPGVLARRVAAIAHQHRQRGFAAPTADPAVKAILRDARRAAVPRRPAAPSPAQLERMAAACPGDLAGLRDRALLLLMATACLGRAAVVALDAEHVRLTSTGADLSNIGSVPMLQLARTADHARCPVRALEAWLRVSETRFGPVFRKVDRWGSVEHRRLGVDAVRRILDRRTPHRRRSVRPVATPAATGATGAT